MISVLPVPSLSFGGEELVFNRSLSISGVIVGSSAFCLGECLGECLGDDSEDNSGSFDEASDASDASDFRGVSSWNGDGDEGEREGDG